MIMGNARIICFIADLEKSNITKGILIGINIGEWKMEYSKEEGAIIKNFKLFWRIKRPYFLPDFFYFYF